MFRLCLTILMLPALASAQSITISGETPTNVVVDTSGKALISIAPASGTGVSLNKYGSFSVGAAGVDLDNRNVGATTIVNEVTGSTRSVIQGDVAVLGTQADVIIANPNGISVSGGRFINTGTTSLITGSSGMGLDGVEFNVSGGDILIGSGGLNAQLQNLDLIAREIRIYGAVDGNNLRFFTGSSQARLGENGLDVATLGGEGARFQLNASAFVSGSAISVLVTGDGPGTFLAGGLASAGGFEVTSSGEIVLNELDVQSVDHSAITGSEVSGNARIASSSGSVTLQATTGSIDLESSELSGVERDFSNFASRGAVTLVAQQDARVSDSDIAIGQDDLNVIALRDFTLDEVDIVGGGDFFSQAGDDTDFSDLSLNIDGRFQINTGQRLSFSGDAEVTGNVAFQASDVLLYGDATQSRIASSTAGIEIVATSGDIVNSGTTVEASGVISGDEEGVNGLVLRAERDIQNISPNNDALSVLFASTGRLLLQAGRDVINGTGRILSNSDLKIEAAGLVQNQTLTKGEGGIQIRRYRGGRSLKSLFLSRTEIVEVRVDHGEVLGNSELAFLQSAAGNLEVEAGAFSNSGGIVSGSDVAITTQGDLENSAKLVGTLSFRQKCYALHCSASGSGEIRSAGGTITANQNMTLNAGDQMTMKGGSLVSGAGTDITAASVLIDSLEVPQLVKRPGTLGDFFRDQVAWIRLSGQSSQLFSLGALELSTLGEVKLRNLIIDAENDLAFKEVNTIVTDEGVVAIGRRPVGGIFSKLLD